MLKPTHYYCLVTNTVALERNIHFSKMSCLLIFAITWAIWLLIMLSGDIHSNPGPIDNIDLLDSTSDSSSSQYTTQQLDLTHHLSFVHYNVQSLYPKLDTLRAELPDFDILAFSETWLSAAHKSDDMLFHNFKTPERKDRSGDPHGGCDIIYKRYTIS